MASDSLLKNAHVKHKSAFEKIMKIDFSLWMVFD